MGKQTYPLFALPNLSILLNNDLLILIKSLSLEPKSISVDFLVIFEVLSGPGVKSNFFF